jgi:hypothetical protein
VQGGRQVRVNVKLTKAEYQSVAAGAIAAGLTVPSYLALTGLRPEGVAAGDAKAALINARGARRVLSGVANNLNELTAKLHSTGEIDPTQRRWRSSLRSWTSRPSRTATAPKPATCTTS